MNWLKALFSRSPDDPQPGGRRTLPRAFFAKRNNRFNRLHSENPGINWSQDNYCNECYACHRKVTGTANPRCNRCGWRVCIQCATCLCTKPLYKRRWYYRR